ncbi:MAG: SUMF1/EgtB/PvdO family nonheme iron enzyme [Phycisphaerales bacterium]|nr:SUMF1/EgtB/PvdO family nonheme iron enzyme [Phycisphaerales bacterium]
MLKRTLFAATVSLPLAAANAQPAPDYGFQWATIGEPGNTAYDGGFWGMTTGRGSVDYTFRISTLQVTTGQWMGFLNTFSQRDGWEYFGRPSRWGASHDYFYSGPGARYLPIDTPNWDMLPVAGISWHEAAMYTNWLHNGKSSDPTSLQTGAYDTGTWGVDPNTGHRTDGGRLPGAKFWIPNLDEWQKAVYYDPDRYAPGESGWWLFPNSSDEPLTPGRPGEGETMAGIQEQHSAEWNVPLGAYPQVTTPWGLLDASGGAHEWIEEWTHAAAPQRRGLNGSYAGQHSPELHDRADAFTGSQRPDASAFWGGLRIASVVPAPGTSALAAFMFVALAARRNRPQKRGDAALQGSHGC